MTLDEAIASVSNLKDGWWQTGDGYMLDDLPAILSAMQQAKATIAEQAAIVDKLPKTKDGVAVVPKFDEIFFNGPSCPLSAIWWDSHQVMTDNGYRRDGSVATPQYLPVSECYSTREAALAAREGK